MERKTVVVVTVETTNQTSFDAVMALSQGDPAATSVLESAPVTNAANQAMSLCTWPGLANQSRAVAIAPSPPPPTSPPPEPPALPPFNILPSGLDVFAFVNVSNPGSAALSQLLTAAAPLVQGAAAVAVTAAVGASVAASALGSAAGGGVGPAALGGAQRNYLMSTLGGAPASCEDPRSTSSGGGWTMGRLNMSDSPNPCTKRRRLQSSGNRPGNQQSGNQASTTTGGRHADDAETVVNIVEEDEDEDLVQRLLVVALMDTMMSVLMIIGICVGVHVLVYFWWKFRANKDYYEWVEPSFTRIIRVEKASGAPLGIELQGSGWIRYVSPSSAAAQYLEPGDKLHMVNGIRMSDGATASAHMLKERLLFLLVSRPAPGAKRRMQPDDAVGRRAAALRASAVSVFEASTAAASASVAAASAAATAIAPPAARVLPPDPRKAGAQPAASLTKGVAFMSRASIVSMNKLPNEKMRKRYAKQMLKSALTESPEFRSLPQALIWPNPEVTLLVSFSTGLLQCACSVLGAAVEGYRTTGANLGLACGVIAAILLFYAHQAYQLVVFYRVHNAAVWNEAEKPESKDEIDDPFFALLTNVSCGRIKPTTRELGSYEAPEEDDEEPARTERALARFFCICRPWFSELSPGDALSELSTWLGDASGGRRGIYYLFGMIVIQLTMSALLGFCYATEFSQTTVGGRLLLAFVALCQLISAVWAQARTANDKIDGLEKTFVYMIEATSTVLLLVAAFLPTEAQEGAEADLDSLATSLNLSATSSTLLMISVFLPMGITVYNSFIAPIVGLFWQADGNMREILTQMFMTLILTPYTVATSFFGFGGLGAVADVVGEMEGSIVEVSGTTGGQKDLTAVLAFGDGDGKLDFDEFCKYVREMQPADAAKISDVELHERFESLDQDGSGKVDVEDLKKMMSAGDRDGDGKLDYGEFCKLVREREGQDITDDELRERFEAADADDSGKVTAAEYLVGMAVMEVDDDDNAAPPPAAEDKADPPPAAEVPPPYDESPLAEEAPPAEADPPPPPVAAVPVQTLAAVSRVLVQDSAPPSNLNVDNESGPIPLCPPPAAAPANAPSPESNELGLEKRPWKQPMGKPSTGKIKRLKREEFLQRVREKRDAREKASHGGVP